MPPKSAEQEEFEKLVAPLIGLEVSRPWKGYGTAIFLELGALARMSGRLRDGSPHHYDRGEASIGVEWDWRVETRMEVAYGSSDGRGDMAEGIATLQGSRLAHLSISRGIPELRVIFSNGQRLRTMIMTNGDPQWSIRLPGGQWLHPMEGQVILNRGEARGLSGEEKQARALAVAATARWGSPRLEPAPGNCRDCRSFVRLNGHFEISDHGCCMAAGGPFDGRAVHVDSGCPSFSGGAGDAG